MRRTGTHTVINVPHSWMFWYSDYNDRCQVMWFFKIIMTGVKWCDFLIIMTGVKWCDILIIMTGVQWCDFLIMMTCVKWCDFLIIIIDVSKMKNKKILQSSRKVQLENHKNKDKIDTPITREWYNFLIIIKCVNFLIFWL